MTDGPPSTQRLFRSFWMGGFEAADHINGLLTRVDMTKATQHDRFATDDFKRLKTLGIRTIRESVSWHQVDRGGAFDLSSLAPIAEAAHHQGMQVIWTLCHYGWPDEIDLFGPEFVQRFARYCAAVARYLAPLTTGPAFYAPINEISFFAYASGEVAMFHPFATKRGDELKRQLVRATIAGIAAIWSVDPHARIVHIDPIIHVFAPDDRPDLAPAAAAHTESQFEAWDLVSGRREPELGGEPRFLDIIGANFYHNSQWQTDGARLRWDEGPHDPRWIGVSELLGRVHRRYGRPLFVGETSHFGVGRAGWLAEIAGEVRRAMAAGTPIEGVCLYPILDRPDWHHSDVWHNSGLWDLEPDADGRLQRVLIADYAAELKRAHRLFEETERGASAGG